jgi:hypothetical protein
MRLLAILAILARLWAAFANGCPEACHCYLDEATRTVGCKDLDLKSFPGNISASVSEKAPRGRRNVLTRLAGVIKAAVVWPNSAAASFASLFDSIKEFARALDRRFLVIDH